MSFFTRSLLASRTRKNVIITLKTSESFQGVLFDADANVVILRNAVAIGVGPKSEHVPIDGELMLFRSDVAYVQLP